MRRSLTSIRHQQSTPFTSFNRDVPQEVVRRILDHDSPQMTAHYARLHDDHRAPALGSRPQGRHHTAAQSLWTPTGRSPTPHGPSSDSARATQALPNGYCGLPLQRVLPARQRLFDLPDVPHDREFLPQHRAQRQQTLQLITAAEARGHATPGRDEPHRAQQPRHHHRRPRNPGDSRTCALTTAFTSSPPPDSGTNSPAPKLSPPCTNSTAPGARSPSKPSPDHALLTELQRRSPHVNGDVVVSGVTVTARDRRW